MLNPQHNYNFLILVPIQNNTKYTRQLSSGANYKVIALSEMEVAKLFIGDNRSDIGSRAEKMKFANTVNGLVTRFARLDFDEALQAEMLVMERIYPN